MYVCVCVCLSPGVEISLAGSHREAGEDHRSTGRWLPHRAGDRGDRTGHHGQPSQRQGERGRERGGRESDGGESRNIVWYGIMLF